MVDLIDQRGQRFDQRPRGKVRIEPATDIMLDGELYEVDWSGKQGQLRLAMVVGSGVSRFPLWLRQRNLL